MTFWINAEPVSVSKPGSGDDLPALPDEVLARHGARVLTPTGAVMEVGGHRPRSTVYRYRTLLIEAAVARDTKAIQAFNDVLATVHLTLRASDLSDVDLPPRQPVPVRLELTDHDAGVVDAWYALQLLRSAAQKSDPIEGAAVEGAKAKRKPGLRDWIGAVALEHLLFGAAIVAPWDTHALSGAPWDTHSLAGAGSYLQAPDGGPLPVRLETSPPARRSPGKRSGFARRPVIAVLDTGVGQHPWFGAGNLTGERDSQRIASLASQGVRVLRTVQEAVITSNTRSEVDPSLRIKDPWDEPAPTDPLAGELDHWFGHGTFIMGIIRQAMPDADIATARVVCHDGLAHEADVLAALWTIVTQVESAKPKDMIDVVSLSIGYYEESAELACYTPKFADVIKELTDLGVIVVAAAGNDATSREFFPAALHDVVSVGALNPNDTKAFFSNEGRWVRGWASGASMVSTFPSDANGSWQASVGVPDLDRQVLDPDDFCCGFAVWNGTSFAAPLAAARIAEKMIECAGGDAALALSVVDKNTARTRAGLTLEGCAQGAAQPGSS